MENIAKINLFPKIERKIVAAEVKNMYLILNEYISFKNAMEHRTIKHNNVFTKTVNLLLNIKLLKNVIFRCIKNFHNSKKK